MRPTRALLTRLAPILLSAAPLAFFAIAPAASAQSHLTPRLIATANPPAAIYAADVNADGFPDLIYIETAPGSSATHILLNDGAGNFIESSALPTGPSIAIADFDGDGSLDLAWQRRVPCQAVPTTPCLRTVIAHGRGDGTFDPAAPAETASAISDTPTRLHASTSPNTAPADASVPSVSRAAYALADFNHDGVLDSATLTPGGIAIVFGPAAPAPSEPTGALTRNPISALTQTSISLILCVDDPGSLFPCGTPIDNTPLLSPVTMYFGQTLDGVAIESATNLTGTINFFDGARIFCTINANLTGAPPGGNACPPASGNFEAGSRTVEAVYSGDFTYAPSTSNLIAVEVFPDLTTATVASSLNPSIIGQSVTFSAAVTGNFATPTGQLSFLDGATFLSTATLDANGLASFTTSALAIGSHPITVVYSGNANFNPATSAVLMQLVNPVPAPVQPVITLASSLNPSAPGQQVTFSATIIAAGANPTGTVVFLDGATVLGTGALSGGVATFSTSTLSLGSHPITATYAGTSSATPVILPGVSAVLTQVVAYPPGSGSFTLTVTPTALTLGVGRTGTLVATITPNSGFAQPVQLSCSDLPPESTCTFVQSIIPSGGGTTSLEIATSAPHDCGDPNHPYFLGANSPLFPPGARRLAAILFPGILLVAIPTFSRRRLRGRPHRAAPRACARRSRHPLRLLPLHRPRHPPR